MPLFRIVILALALGLAVASPAAAADPLVVNGGSVTEGNSGTKNAEFTVTNPSLVPVAVKFSTEENGSASSPEDYADVADPLETPLLPPGGTQIVKVQVNGDTANELDETFKLKADSQNDLLVADGEGIGTIVDDDNQSPTARVDVNPQRAFVGKVIEFNGSRSTDPEGQPLQYSWDLDANGSFETPTGTEPAIGFAFFTTGLQAVGLQVTDPGLKSGSATGFALIFPPPAGFGRDTTPPSTNLFPVRRSLRLVLRRRGVRVRYGCSEACLIAGSVGVDRRTGRRIGLKGRNRTMGRGFSATTKAGSKVFTLKLSRRARRALAKVKEVRVNLRFAVRDAAFNVRVTNHRITLKR